eukprot:5021324-Pyramimonas_sp.AAC.1
MGWSQQSSQPMPDATPSTSAPSASATWSASGTSTAASRAGCALGATGAGGPSPPLEPDAVQEKRMSGHHDMAKDSHVTRHSFLDDPVLQQCAPPTTLAEVRAARCQDMDDSD